MDDFDKRIEAALTWEAASDIYAEARGVLSQDGFEWARCSLAMHHREPYKRGPYGPKYTSEQWQEIAQRSAEASDQREFLRMLKGRT